MIILMKHVSHWVPIPNWDGIFVIWGKSSGKIESIRKLKLWLWDGGGEALLHRLITRRSISRWQWRWPPPSAFPGSPPPKLYSNPPLLPIGAPKLRPCSSDHRLLASPLLLLLVSPVINLSPPLFLALRKLWFRREPRWWCLRRRFLIRRTRRLALIPMLAEWAHPTLFCFSIFVYLFFFLFILMNVYLNAFFYLEMDGLEGNAAIRSLYRSWDFGDWRDVGWKLGFFFILWLF